MASSGRVLIVDDHVEFADLLATLVRARGFIPLVTYSATGAEAILDRYEPDAIVLDLLLPDRVGHRLLDRLSEEARSPKVFVVTAVFKGSDERERLVARGRVAGWFEKPLDTSVLLDALAQVVEEAADSRTASLASTIRGAPNPDAALEPEVGYGDFEDVLGGTHAVAAVGAFEPPEAEVTRLVPGLVAPEASRAGSSGLHVESELHVGSELVESGPRARAWSADLQTVPPAHLMRLFYASRASGRAVFRLRDATKTVAFSEGYPVHARSNQEADCLGAIARRSTGLTAAELEHALALARGTDRMIGDVLVELGFLDEAKRRELLLDQTRAILYSVLDSVEGTVEVDSDTTGLELADRIELKEHPGGLVLGAVRTRCSLDRLRELLPPMTRLLPAPEPPVELEALPLQDVEAGLLLAVTGLRSVAELVETAAGRLDERGVLALLHALRSLGILEIAGAHGGREG